MTGPLSLDLTETYGAGEVARAVLRLIRWENCVAVGLTTLLGAHLAGNAGAPRALVAAAAVIALHAAGTAFNDRCDVAIDRLARPRRPLPSGRLSVEYAERLSVVLLVLGLCLSATLGPFALAVAALVAIASAAYAVRLKNSVLIGNLTVAMLSAATVPFGAAAVLPGEAIPRAAVRGGLLILLYMVAYEVLKCLQDIESDAASGLHTIATNWGPQAARATAVTALAAFGSVAVWPLVDGAASAAYGIAVWLPLGCMLGCALSAYLLRPPRTAWDHAVRWLKVGWFLSLPALGLIS